MSNNASDSDHKLEVLPTRSVGISRLSDGPLVEVFSYLSPSEQSNTLMAWVTHAFVMERRQSQPDAEKKDECFSVGSIGLSMDFFKGLAKFLSFQEDISNKKLINFVIRYLRLLSDLKLLSAENDFLYAFSITATKESLRPYLDFLFLLGEFKQENFVLSTENLQKVWDTLLRWHIINNETDSVKTICSLLSCGANPNLVVSARCIPEDEAIIDYTILTRWIGKKKPRRDILQLLQYDFDLTKEQRREYQLGPRRSWTPLQYACLIQDKNAANALFQKTKDIQQIMDLKQQALALGSQTSVRNMFGLDFFVVTGAAFGAILTIILQFPDIRLSVLLPTIIIVSLLSLSFLNVDEADEVSFSTLFDLLKDKVIEFSPIL